MLYVHMLFLKLRIRKFIVVVFSLYHCTGVFLVFVSIKIIDFTRFFIAIGV